MDQGKGRVLSVISRGSSSVGPTAATADTPCASISQLDLVCLDYIYGAICSRACRFFQVPRRLIDMAEEQVGREAAVVLTAAVHSHSHTRTPHRSCEGGS